MAKKDEKKKGLKKLADRIKKKVANETKTVNSNKTAMKDTVKKTEIKKTNNNKPDSKSGSSVNKPVTNTSKSNTHVTPTANDTSLRDFGQNVMDNVQKKRVEHINNRIKSLKEGESNDKTDEKIERLKGRKQDIKQRKRQRHENHEKADKMGYEQLSNDELMLYQNALRQFGGDGNAVNNYFNTIGRGDITQKIARNYEYSANANQFGTGMLEGSSPVSIQNQLAQQSGGNLDVGDTHNRAYQMGYMLGNVLQSGATGGFMGMAEGTALKGLKGFTKAAGFNALIDAPANVFEGAKVGQDAKSDIENNVISADEIAKNGYSTYDGKTSGDEVEAGKNKGDRKGIRDYYDASLAEWNADMKAKINDIPKEYRDEVAIGVDKYGYLHISTEGEEDLQKILAYYDTAENPEYTQTHGDTVKMYGDKSTRDAIVSTLGNTAMSAVLGGGMEQLTSKIGNKAVKEGAEKAGKKGKKGKKAGEAVEDAQTPKDVEGALEEGEEIVDTAPQKNVDEQNVTEPKKPKNEDNQNTSETSKPKNEDNQTPSETPKEEPVAEKPPKEAKKRGRKKKEEQNADNQTPAEEPKAEETAEPKQEEQAVEQKETVENTEQNVDDQTPKSEPKHTEETAEKPKLPRKGQKATVSEINKSSLTDEQKAELKAKGKELNSEHLDEYGRTPAERKEKLKDTHATLSARLKTATSSEAFTSLGKSARNKETDRIKRVMSRIENGTATNKDVELAEKYIKEVEGKYKPTNVDSQTPSAVEAPKETATTNKDLPKAKDKDTNTDAQNIPEKKLTKEQKKEGTKRAKRLENLRDEMPFERESEVEQFIYDSLGGAPDHARLLDDEKFNKLIKDIEHARDTGEPLKVTNTVDRNIDATNKAINKENNNADGGEFYISDAVNDLASKDEMSKTHEHLSATDTDPRTITGKNLNAIREITLNKDKYPEAYKVLIGYFGKDKNGRPKTSTVKINRSGDYVTEDFVVGKKKAKSTQSINTIMIPSTAKSEDSIAKELAKTGKDKKTTLADVWKHINDVADKIEGKNKRVIEKATEVKKKWGVSDDVRDIVKDYGFDGSEKSFRKAIDNMYKELYSKDDAFIDMAKYGNISEEQYKAIRKGLASIENKAVNKASEVRKLDESLKYFADVENAFKQMDDIDKDIQDALKQASELISDNGKEVSDEAFDEYISMLNTLFEGKKKISLDILDGTDSIIKNSNPLISLKDMTDLRASVREVVDHMGTAGYGKNSQTLADRKSVYEAMAEDVKLSSDSEDIQKIITNWEESEKISKEFADEFDASHKKLEKSLRERYEREVKNGDKQTPGLRPPKFKTKEGKEIFDEIESVLNGNKFSKAEKKAIEDNAISNYARKMLEDAIRRGDSEVFGIKIPLSKYERLIDNANGIKAFISRVSESDAGVKDVLNEVKALSDSYIVRLTDRVPSEPRLRSKERAEEARKYVEEYQREKAEKAKIAEEWRKTSEYVPARTNDTSISLLDDSYTPKNYKDIEHEVDSERLKELSDNESYYSSDMTDKFEGNAYDKLNKFLSEENRVKDDLYNEALSNNLVDTRSTVNNVATQSNKRLYNMKVKLMDALGVDTSPRLSREQNESFANALWGEFHNKSIPKEELEKFRQNLAENGRELGRITLEKLNEKDGNFHKKNVQKGFFKKFCKENGIEFNEKSLKTYYELVDDLIKNPAPLRFPSNDAGKELDRLWNKLAEKAQKGAIEEQDFVDFIFNIKELAYRNRGTFRLGKSKKKLDAFGIEVKKHTGRMKKSEQYESLETQLMRDLKHELGVFGITQNKARVDNLGTGVKSYAESPAQQAIRRNKELNAKRDAKRNALRKNEEPKTPEKPLPKNSDDQTPKGGKKYPPSEEKVIERAKNGTSIVETSDGTRYIEGKTKKTYAEGDTGVRSINGKKYNVSYEKASDGKVRCRIESEYVPSKQKAVEKAKAEGIKDENVIESAGVRADIEEATNPTNVIEEKPLRTRNTDDQTPKQEVIKDRDGNENVTVTHIDADSGLDVVHTEPTYVGDNYTRSEDSMGLLSFDKRKYDEIEEKAKAKKRDLRRSLTNSQEEAERLGDKVDASKEGLDARRTIEAKLQRERSAKQSADYQIHNGIYDSEGKRIFTDDMTEEKYWSMSRKERKEYDKGHTVGGLLKEARKGKFMDELQAYMYHKLNIERTEKGKPLFDGGDSNAVIEAIEKSPNGDRIKEISQELRKISEAHVRDRLVGSGYMSEENFEKYISSWNEYVPTYRDLDGIIASVGETISVDAIPRQGRVSARALKGVKGGDAPLLPLLEQYNKKFENIENMVRQNEANDYIINLIKDHPEATKDFGIYVTDNPRIAMKAVADSLPPVKYEGTKRVSVRAESKFEEGKHVIRTIDGKQWDCVGVTEDGKNYYVPQKLHVTKEEQKELLKKFTDSFMNNTRKFAEKSKDLDDVDYSEAEKFIDKFLKDNNLPNDETNKSMLMSIVRDDVTRLRQRDAFDVSVSERDAFLKDLTGNNQAYELVSYKNGVESKAYITRDLALALKSVTNPTTLTPDQKYLKKAYELLRKTNDIFKFGHTTGNPIFHLRNFFRDGGTYLIQSEAGGLRRIGNMGRAFEGMSGVNKEYAKYWQIYNANGGSSANFSSTNKAIIKGNTALHTMAKTVNDAFTKFGDTGESFWRFAEFCEGMEKYADKPNRIELAMEMASDVTVNFGKSGSLARTADAAVPYLNASIQGLVKTVKTFQEHPVKTTAWGLGTITSVYMIDTALLWNNPNYQKLSDEVRQKNFIIPVNGGFGTASDFIKVPLSREWAIPFASVFEMVMDNVAGDGDAMNALRKNTKDAFWISDSNIMQGWTDAKANRNYFGSPLTYNTDGLYKDEIEDDTSNLAKGIASVGNSIFERTHGGMMAYEDGVQQFDGWANVTSPVRVDYLLDNYAGFLGTLARGSINNSGKPLRNSVNGVRDEFKKSFTANAGNSSENVNDYYNNKSMAERYAVHEGDGVNKTIAEEYKRFNNKYKVKVKLPNGDTWTSDEGIKAINRQIKAYKNDSSLSYKTRNAYVKAYKLALDKYTTKANKSAEKIREGYAKNPEWWSLPKETRDAYKNAGGKDELGMSKKKFGKTYSKISEYADVGGYTSINQMANGYKAVAMAESGVTSYKQAQALCGDDFSKSAWEKYVYMANAGVTIDEFDEIYKKKKKIKNPTNREIADIVYSSDLPKNKQDAIYYQIKN